MNEQQLKQQSEAVRANLAKGTMRLGGNPSYVPVVINPVPVVTEPDEPHAGVPSPRKLIVNSQPLPDLSGQDFPIPGQSDDVIGRLLDGPAVICEKQASFDREEREYRAQLALLTIRALSEPLFPGKEPGSTRAASNDTERSAAVERLVNTDAHFIVQAMNREAALRELNRARNVFEGAKLAATLLAAAIR